VDIAQHIGVKAGSPLLSGIHRPACITGIARLFEAYIAEGNPEVVAFMQLEGDVPPSFQCCRSLSWIELRCN